MAIKQSTSTNHRQCDCEPWISQCILCLYAGDFNCRHADWGYDNNSPDGECLAGWASVNCLALLYNAKDAASFYSGRWNTGTNPDLAFASVGPNSRLPNKRVLDKFPRSQH